MPFRAWSRNEMKPMFRQLSRGFWLRRSAINWDADKGFAYLRRSTGTSQSDAHGG
jgi:hypothetical protein